jgi:2-phosphoglycerate kinase
MEQAVRGPCPLPRYSVLYERSAGTEEAQPVNHGCMQRMMYLIGGAPKCGKTMLAMRLSKRLGIPWVSGDTLQEVVFRSTPKDQWGRRFPYKVIRQRTDGSTDQLYNLLTLEEIRKCYRTAARSTWAGIEAFIGRERSHGHDYIVEGLQVEPRLVARLRSRYSSRQVHSVFMVKTDRKELVANFGKRQSPKDWILDNTYEVATYETIAEMIAGYSRVIEREARRLNLHVLDMSNGFNRQLNVASALLVK